ncbi:MAG: aminotransferase class V-fold PLP-dependent enzyme [Thermomicrobium sp.]|nr:aminotransferase class V-fold PLP-dependent enzyme [Thermomicrobium sp.]
MSIVVRYFDNATTSWPKPEPVLRTLARFLEGASGAPRRPGHRLAQLTWEAVERARARLAALFGVHDPRRVVFTTSGTDALNLAIKGLLGSGDHAVTTVLEHAAVRRPLRALEMVGVSTTVVRVDPRGIVDPDDVERAFRPNTRLVVVSHASAVTGTVQPVREIAERAHAHGVLVLVDAGQTAGVLPFTLEELDADLVALSGHKWLLGPPGTGALLLGPRLELSELTPLREGATASELAEGTRPWSLPERYEAGTPNSVGIAALGAALEWRAAVGPEALAERLQQLTFRLLRGLARIPGVELLGGCEHAGRVPIVSCLVQGWRPQELSDALERCYGILCAAGFHGAADACRALGAFPYGTVRLSPGWSTSEEDVDRVVEAIAELARQPGRVD